MNIFKSWFMRFLQERAVWGVSRSQKWVKTLSENHCNALTNEINYGGCRHRIFHENFEMKFDKLGVFEVTEWFWGQIFDNPKCLVAYNSLSGVGVVSSALISADFSSLTVVSSMLADFSVVSPDDGLMDSTRAADSVGAAVDSAATSVDSAGAATASAKHPKTTHSSVFMVKFDFGKISVDSGKVRGTCLCWMWCLKDASGRLYTPQTKPFQRTISGRDLLREGGEEIERLEIEIETFSLCPPMIHQGWIIACHNCPSHNDFNTRLTA